MTILKKGTDDNSCKLLDKSYLFVFPAGKWVFITDWVWRISGTFYNSWFSAERPLTGSLISITVVSDAITRFSGSPVS
jgi:hypothetical protein